MSIEPWVQLLYRESVPAAAGPSDERAIAPVNLTVFGVLRDTHSVLVYLLVPLIAAHISAVLTHAIGLGDGMLRRMTFRRRHTP
ncbi:hypothetical protein [Mycolicibacterium komossense]|uniref:hypothetical protein n=1 Tax=Mycolicibacterium komossense TaxID=1779 RepID=UPI0021F3AECB|nr:hypothetical protein [Mycolicibacterium komossense]